MLPSLRLAAGERPRGPLPRVHRAAVVSASVEKRLRELFGARWATRDLIRFHTAHKLLLMAHSTDAYRQLGRLVAEARRTTRGELELRYTDGFMRAMEQTATTRGHTNVLQHMAGYFKNRLDGASKRELADAIENYRVGLAPLDVPLTRVRRYVRILGIAYLAGQLYLSAYGHDPLPGADKGRLES